MTVLLVALGAAVGAPLRYLVDGAVQRRHDRRFPWGTFTVNAVACLVLGLVTGLVTARSAPAGVGALVGTGLCGALSTYSTFSWETMRLWEEHARVPAVANVVASVVVGLGAAALGLQLGGA